MPTKSCMALWARLLFLRAYSLLPCMVMSSSGGIFQWRQLEVSWMNTLVPGCQLMGAPYWGRTTIRLGKFSLLLA